MFGSKKQLSQLRGKNIVVEISPERQVRMFSTAEKHGLSPSALHDYGDVSPNIVSRNLFSDLPQRSNSKFVGNGLAGSPGRHVSNIDMHLSSLQQERYPNQRSHYHAISGEGKYGSGQKAYDSNFSSSHLQGLAQSTSQFFHKSQI